MTHHDARLHMPPSPADLAADSLHVEIQYDAPGYTVRIERGALTLVSGPHRWLLGALFAAWRLGRRHRAKPAR